jgi:hypothetical protein
VEEADAVMGGMLPATKGGLEITGKEDEFVALLEVELLRVGLDGWFVVVRIGGGDGAVNEGFEGVR